MSQHWYQRISVVALGMLVSLNPIDASADEPTCLVIAHRGASGYLPEHSEGAKVLAFAQGADVIEQDVVLTKDEVLVVSHDTTMDATTNVQEVYPNRQRGDGKYYWADFTWDELKLVSLRERSLGTPNSTRFPYATDSRVMRLEDELKLIRGLNKVLHRNVGFHIELKGAAWHQEQFGKRIGDKLLELLAAMQISPENDVCFIQCFEADELVYLHDERKCPYKLVQLLGGRPLGLVSANVDSDPIAVLKAEFPVIARYANGIGPAIPLLLREENGSIASTGVVEAAHAVGLVVHPYTVRIDALPKWCDSVDQLHELLIKQLKVDGFFTDFPNLGAAAR